jgi:hypothetical protein
MAKRKKGKRKGHRPASKPPVMKKRRKKKGGKSVAVAISSTVKKMLGLTG